MSLSIRNLRKSFGELKVLQDVNMELEHDCIYCLMGASGSGKTTLFRILMELENVDAGEIIWTESASANPPRFSVVFQEDRLCEAFTPIENVMMVTGKLYPKSHIIQELSRLLPEESLTRPVSTLSGGMKRRTTICRAMLASADVFLMDEPFTGLDEDTKQMVISYIKEKTKGKLVIISTHQDEDVTLLGATRLTI